MRVAITGHVAVTEETARWVSEALDRHLAEVVRPGWRGVTCLARGADQLFAEAVLRRRGKYDVVLPAHDYQLRMNEFGTAGRLAELLRTANRVRTLPFAESSRAAFRAASQEMLQECDVLLAVWDGSPSRAAGDTADVVRMAQERDIEVRVVWAEHCSRLTPTPTPLDVTPAAAPGPG